MLPHMRFSPPPVPEVKEQYWMMVMEITECGSSTTMHFHTKGSWVKRHIELTKYASEKGLKYVLLNRFAITEEEYKELVEELGF